MSPPSPEKVLELARRFTESRILLSGAELDIFTVLADKPLTVREVTGKLKVHSRPMTILLDALSAMGLLVKQDGRYRTEPALVSSLSSKTPDSILPMILHNVSMWKSWSGLTAIVRETGAPRHPAAIFRDKAELGAFIGAMHVVGAPQAARLTAMLDP
ncbi:MAG: methyltransferase dimerization domain-containing protein, partial [Thermodesulfobacteriota bacterium]|nr:methyltransferase dimerization domain-containing protein [Thermodesulfobacteriota bacterium]